eukprot:CAMPEP_0172420244 /NCGR_PEP_ID=MMETSP1064-20121228/6654_1 /TAXON_ID=202472 /ORGANISM="Aulacoseira subarctica , Strain CCAP 1002/5" /LENGTH=198 /DNA_ID=CAMNT_0013160137 /DNA_START=75 /DNA_END=671 /DNA_ORIENTATION=-
MTQKTALKARMIRTFLAFSVFGSACNFFFSDAFQGVARTTFAPFETETETTTRTKRSSPGQTKQRPFYTTPTTNGNPLEYLQDDPQEWRGPDDPHHILLMGKTFEQPRITVQYVAGSLTYVLGMPSGDADEHAAFAKEEGVSILGTWPRKECLDLGVKLQMRDLVCRVVPGTACGAQGWQAKDAAANNDVWDVPSLSD